MNLSVSTKYVCGIDLHAREMSVCVMDKPGKILLKKDMSCSINVFMRHIGSPAHNWMETSGKKSKPLPLIGKKSGHSPTKTKVQKSTSKNKGAVVKVSGRKTLRTTGKVKA